MKTITPVSKNSVPDACANVIGVPVANLSKVVIGDPNSKMAVANDALTCLRPLYQVKTYINKKPDVTKIQLTCADVRVVIKLALFIDTK